ncbi:gamma-glutamyltransferase [Pelagibius sp.]|uniref:gamma-glutamyltransferase n=1 Tax=Pelagibius sp. TaxID=1931238 RepID=UPI003B510057
MPFGSIPKHLLRAFQRKPASAALKRIGLAGLTLAVLGACEASREPGVIAPVEGFAGLVAGDEPRAVTIGRDILGNGGSAADAAAAMYFTMTATLPSRVGMASSGVCLVHNAGLMRDDATVQTEVYEFLPEPGKADGLQLAGPRAMAVMHARHGLARWGMLLNDAERLSRVGNSVSRAFARDIQAAAAFVSADPALRQLLSNRAGVLASEGDVLVFSELSGTISGLRRQGAGYLYGGAYANRFVEAAQASGVSIAIEDLRQMLPRVSEPLTVPFGDNVAYFPTNDGGLTTAQMWGMLTEVERYAGRNPVEKAHLLAEASQRSFALRGTWLGQGGTQASANLVSEAHLAQLLTGYSGQQHNKLAVEGASPQTVSNPFSAGIVVADRWSNAVACSFSMNGLFGAGRLVPGTGILLPKPAAPGANSLSVGIVANPFNGNVYLAGTASGGLAAPAALARVMLEGIEPEASIEDALRAPRLVNVASPDVTFYEPDLEDSVLAGLRQRGHTLQPEAEVGRANAFKCPIGLRTDDLSCVVDTDRRGHGLAVRVQ